VCVKSDAFLLPNTWCEAEEQPWNFLIFGQREMPRRNKKKERENEEV
jgi:hypothetical protein